MKVSDCLSLIDWRNRPCWKYVPCNQNTKLWPLIISIFFASMNIYTAFSMFLNQFFS